MQVGSSEIWIFDYFLFFILIFFQSGLYLSKLLLRLQDLQFQSVLHRLSFAISFALGPSVSLNLCSLILQAAAMEIFLEICNFILNFNIFSLLKWLLLAGITISRFFNIFGGFTVCILVNILAFCKRMCCHPCWGVFLVNCEGFEKTGLGVVALFLAFHAIK